MPRQELPRGVQPQEVLRDDLHRLAHLRTRASPLLRPQAREPRDEASGAVVARDAVDLLHGDVELVLPGIAKFEVVAALAVHVATDDAAEARDPVRSEEHTSELQSLMRNPYAVLCL